MDIPDPNKNESSEIIPEKEQESGRDKDVDAALEMFDQALNVTKENINQLRSGYPVQPALSGIAALLAEHKESSLYHYTSAEGIQGILESGSLYATSGYFLNDSSEVDYGCQMFGSILDGWCKNNQNSAIGTMILKLLRDNFTDLDKIRDKITSVYVVCFCEEPNLLSQWRTYGQSGGYSIGFNREGLEKYKSDNGLMATLEQVIYQKSRQQAILRKLIGNGMPELERTEIRAEYDKLSEIAKTMFINMMVALWQFIAFREVVRFKHPAFEDEREWRLISRPDYRALSTDKFKSINFRPMRGVPTPYIELKPEGNLHPITSVRYGPTLDKKRVEHGLSLLLRKKGYSQIKLLGSEIPVRL